MYNPRHRSVKKEKTWIGRCLGSRPGETSSSGLATSRSSVRPSCENASKRCCRLWPRSATTDSVDPRCLCRIENYRRCLKPTFHTPKGNVHIVTEGQYIVNPIDLLSTQLGYYIIPPRKHFESSPACGTFLFLDIGCLHREQNLFTSIVKFIIRKRNNVRSLRRAKVIIIAHVDAQIFTGDF